MKLLKAFFPLIMGLVVYLAFSFIEHFASYDTRQQQVELELLKSRITTLEKENKELVEKRDRAVENYLILTGKYNQATTDYTYLADGVGTWLGLLKQTGEEERMK